MFAMFARYILSVLFAFLAIPFTSFSQSANTLSSEQVFEFLDPVYGVDQRLVSGSYYYGPRKGLILGHAFFIDETWKKGSVSLDNISYENLDLKYDIVQNQVVLKFKNLNHSEFMISLQKENIDTFWMDNRVFVPFLADTSNNSKRFCELMAIGEVNYLISKRKVFQLVNGSTYDFEYQEYILQYLQINNQWIPFNRWRKIFHLFPDIKQDLKKFIRSEGLILWKKKIDERKVMIEYCNKLLMESK
jgi:hypothetical protein